MIVALVTGAILAAESRLYQGLFAAQAVFYAAAVAGLFTPVPLFRIPAFLLTANLAVLTAWVRFARGERMITWRPSERQSIIQSQGTIR